MWLEVTAIHLGHSPVLVEVGDRPQAPLQTLCEPTSISNTSAGLAQGVTVLSLVIRLFMNNW
jgi:hypothetical protein